MTNDQFKKAKEILNKIEELKNHNNAIARYIAKTDNAPRLVIQSDYSGSYELLKEELMPIPISDLMSSYFATIDAEILKLEAKLKMI